MLLEKHTFSLKKIVPAKTWIKLLLIWIIVLLFSIWGDILTGEMTYIRALVIFSILLVTIISAAFGVVKEADELAHKLGEPYGTLILTLSIVSIEAILISAVMLGPGEFPTIGKDSIFAVMMIIMNLMIGISILTGGLKHKEQEYNAQGTMSYTAMIIMLGGLSMILPNFIKGGGNGMFSTTQAVTLSILIIVLYGFFLVFQTKGYSHLFMQPKKGCIEIPFKDRASLYKDIKNSNPSDRKSEILIRTAILLAMILPIVLLSHNMANVIDFGVKAANLPIQLSGIIIAIIVFTPESITAVKAALNNEFQRTINLCHGAFVSTVGLTVPAVLIIGLISGKTVLFGLTATEMILFFITLLLSLMTFSGKRTTPFTGIMHLVLFVVFILLVFYP
ncbi:calcium:proton antiporter [Elizabethkingia meningoseptica]|uniref:calcium:proton antiporter n=1 Tax=Elizabethkingia meningoseptica TaxID=238 RepID=UPI00389154C3